MWQLICTIGRGALGTWHAYRQARRIKQATWRLIGDQLSRNGGTTTADKVFETHTMMAEMNTLITNHIAADERRFQAIFLRLGIMPGAAEEAVVDEKMGREQ